MTGAISAYIRTSNQPNISTLNNVTFSTLVVTGQISGDIYGSVASVTDAVQSNITNVPGLTAFGTIDTSTTVAGALIVSSNVNVSGSLTANNVVVNGVLTTRNTNVRESSNIVISNATDDGPGLIVKQSTVNGDGIVVQMFNTAISSNQPLFLISSNVQIGNTTDTSNALAVGGSALTYSNLIVEGNVTANSMFGANALSVSTVDSTTSSATLTSTYDFASTATINTYVASLQSTIAAFPTTCNIITNSALTTNYIEFSNLVNSLSIPSSGCNIATVAFVNACNAALVADITSQLTPMATTTLVNASNVAVSNAILALATQCNLITNTNLTACNITYNAQLAAFPTTYGLATNEYVATSSNAIVTAAANLPTTCNLTTYAYVSACNTALNAAIPTYSNLASQTYVDTCNIALQNTIPTLPTALGIATNTSVNSCNVVYAAQISAVPTTYNLANQTYVNSNMPVVNYILPQAALLNGDMRIGVTGMSTNVNAPGTTGINTGVIGMGNIVNYTTDTNVIGNWTNFHYQLKGGYEGFSQGSCATTDLPYTDFGISNFVRIWPQNGKVATDLSLCQIYQTLTGASLEPYLGKTVTLSFYNRAGGTLPTYVSGYVFNSSTTTYSASALTTYYSGTYPYSTVNNAIATTGNMTSNLNWTRSSVTGFVPSNATAITVAVSMQPTGASLGVAQSNAYNYIDFTGVQLDIGSNALAFIPYRSNICPTTINSVYTSNLSATISNVAATIATQSYVGSCNTVFNTTLAAFPASQNIATHAYVNACNVAISAIASPYATVTYANTCNQSVDTAFAAFPTTYNLVTQSNVDACNTMLTSAIAKSNTMLTTTYQTISFINSCNVAYTTQINAIPLTYGLVTQSYVNSCNTSAVTALNALPVTSNLANIAYVTACNVAQAANSVSANYVPMGYASACNIAMLTAIDNLPTTSNLATKNYVDTVTTLPNLTTIGSNNTTVTINGYVIASNLNIYGTTAVFNTKFVDNSNMIIQNAGSGSALTVSQASYGGTGNGVVADFFANAVSTTTPIVRISDGGNFGILTSTPQYTLDVASTAQIKNALTITCNVSITSGFTTTTAVSSDNSTKVATTAFVANVTPSFTSYAPLASPAFTGAAYAPTPVTITNNTTIATTAFAMANVNAMNTSLYGPLSTSNTWTGSNTFTYVNAQNTGVYRNKIVNGAMLVDQRGTATTALTITNTGGGYSVDKFYTSMSNLTSAAFTAKQSTLPAALSGFQSCLNIAVTTANTNVNATDSLFCYTNVEGNLITDLQFGTANAQSVTLSYWIYSSITGTFANYLRNGPAMSRSIVNTVTIPTANTWQYVQVTFPGDTSTSYTWPLDNTNSLQVGWAFKNASAYNAPSLGAWNAGSYTTTSGITNFMGTVGNNIYITGVQLEKGTLATPFEFRSYPQELALCQRYYEKSYDLGTVPGTITTNGSVSWSIQAVNRPIYAVKYNVPKRTTPTITIYNPSTGASGTAQNIDAVTTANLTVNDISMTGFKMFCQTSNVVGQAIMAHYTISAE